MPCFCIFWKAPEGNLQPSKITLATQITAEDGLKASVGHKINTTVLSRLKPHGLLTETGIGGSQNMSFRLISQWGFIQNAQWDINRNDQRACGGFLRRVALFLLVPLWTALRMWMARGGSRNLLACLCGFWQYKFICLFIMAELLENTLNLNNHLMLREVTVWENGMLLVQHGARQLILVVSTFLWKCEWYFCVN